MPEATATYPDSQAPCVDRLYEQHGAAIFRFCLSRLRSRDDAEDAVQDTFLRACAALRRGVRPYAEQAWLFKIAHNVCLTQLISSTRRSRVEFARDFQLLENDPPAPQRMAEELFDLDAVLAEMPERLRRPFLLREWQGLSYNEIAADLRLSHSAVETLIFRARRHVAAALDGGAAASRPVALAA